MWFKQHLFEGEGGIYCEYTVPCFIPLINPVLRSFDATMSIKSAALKITLLCFSVLLRASVYFQLRIYAYLQVIANLLLGEFRGNDVKL